MMSWATRGTLLAAVLWGAFILLLAASAASGGGLQQMPFAFVGIWFLIFAIPLLILWTLLALIFGNRGKIQRY